MATTLEQNTLEAQPREAGSKNDARAVRRGGKIPAVVYGAGKDSVSISVDPRHVQRILLVVSPSPGFCEQPPQRSLVRVVGVASGLFAATGALSCATGAGAGPSCTAPFEPADRLCTKYHPSRIIRSVPTP